MATPSLEIPAEWMNEIQRLSRCCMALILHTIGMRASGPHDLFSRYLVGSPDKLEVLESKWKSAGYTEVTRPLVSRYGGIGRASDYDFRYKLIIIDADHSNSIEYVISLVKLSLLARTEDSTILRYVFLSFAPVDKYLGRMLAVSTSASEIPVTTFHLTQQANLPSLSNLRWVQYDATDEEYPDAVMKAVAPDYCMDQESKSSVYKMMGTLFFWDEGC
ncbi:hypothetical protein CSAL01_09068 [Colletotrichum salicis]|uniref:Uncharacterized protein n=1 Tax=Colletotrichum salicis TaxID=1209931 RepID=A0A135UIC3_9PEZI|nr:hypothetical protein CSAL01_09068 [Colletotrichum salicis]